MSILSFHLKLLWPGLTLLALLFAMSCNSREGLEGIYRARGEKSEEQQGSYVELELKHDGTGVWRVTGNEVSFEWYVKNGELRINVKEGGVIIGEVGERAIHIALPGKRPLIFEKGG